MLGIFSMLRNMTRGHKFDPAKMNRLNDPQRFEELPPEVLWKQLVPGDAGNDDRHEAGSATSDTANGHRRDLVLVDLGAGTGVFAREFLKRLGPGGRVYACDVSDVMIDYMEQEIPAEDRTKLMPLRSEESALPLEDESVDAVYTINVYHEFESATAMLAEVYRVLRPGGRFVVVDWSPEGSESGPPKEHRVPSQVIEDEISDAGFQNSRWISELPQHQFLAADKPR